MKADINKMEFAMKPKLILILLISMAGFFAATAEGTGSRFYRREPLSARSYYDRHQVLNDYRNSYRHYDYNSYRDYGYHRAVPRYYHPYSSTIRFGNNRLYDCGPSRYSFLGHGRRYYTYPDVIYYSQRYPSGLTFSYSRIHK